MATTSSHCIIAGSERTPMRGARALGPVQADHQVEVTVRLRAPAGAAAAQAQAEGAQLAARRYLTREEFAQRYGASAADIAVVTAFAQQHHLTVVHTDAARRSIVLAGAAAAMGAAFGTSIEEFESPHGTYAAAWAR